MTDEQLDLLAKETAAILPPKLGVHVAWNGVTRSQGTSLATIHTDLILRLSLYNEGDLTKEGMYRSFLESLHACLQKKIAEVDHIWDEIGRPKCQMR